MDEVTGYSYRSCARQINKIRRKTAINAVGLLAINRSKRVQIYAHLLLREECNLQAGALGNLPRVAASAERERANSANESFFMRFSVHRRSGSHFVRIIFRL